MNTEEIEYIEGDKGLEWRGLIRSSDTTRLQKTGAIFESAKGTSIKWETNNKGENYIFRDRHDKKIYHISLSEPAHPLIPTYSAGNHEIAHMAFDSFTGKSCKEFYAKWVDKFPKDFKYKPLAKEMYEMLSNIIEDERIESLLGDIYIGTKKRFDEYKVDIGASYKEKPKDPCGARLFM